eukprot:CCRYP_019908-RA/>CCRYP_019908-RA protein AED:0.03 eAED:0.03 QI:70/1/1/1/1/1/2/55/539
MRRPPVTVLGLKLFLGTGICLFVGIQVRLLAYSSHSLFVDTLIADLAPIPISTLNSTCVQHLMKKSPIFLFGHSTGHSGSGTFHESMSQPGCPWNVTVDKFEYTVKEERKLIHDTKCSLTHNKLIPRIISLIKNSKSVVDDDRISSPSESIAMQREGINPGGIAYIDLGHFHNGGRTLECLAKELGERSVFIHIRRNRYSIARSFTPTRNDSLSENEYSDQMRLNRLKEIHNRGKRDTLPKHIQDKYRVDDDQSPAGNYFHHLRRKRSHDDKKFYQRRNEDDDYVIDEEAMKRRLRPHHRSYRTKHSRLRGQSLDDEMENDSTLEKQRLPKTPCLAQNIVNGKNVSHPGVAICPRSTEGRGPVNLPISSDEVWDSLSPFQQFLWYADEMEHRWNTLQKMFYTNHTISSDVRRHVPGGHGIPTFIEVTWDSEGELHDGVNWVREQLGCSPAMYVINSHPHVHHRKYTLNCSQFIWEDLEYRKKMNFSSEIAEVLFPRHLPQHVDNAACSENRHELQRIIRDYSEFHGIPFNPELWKLPHN